MNELGRGKDQIQLWKRAWERLTPKGRVELLRRLGAKTEKSTKSIHLNKVRLVDDFRRLPMEISMLLRRAFNGAVFSKACLKRARRCDDVEIIVLG